MVLNDAGEEVLICQEKQNVFWCHNKETPKPLKKSSIVKMYNLKKGLIQLNLGIIQKHE